MCFDLTCLWRLLFTDPFRRMAVLPHVQPPHDRIHSRTEAQRLVQDSQVYHWVRKHRRRGQDVMPRRFVSKHRRSTLENCFKSLDADRSGEIDRDEIKFALKELGMSVRHVDSIIREGDKDGDGSLTLDEFIALVAKVSALQEQRAVQARTAHRGAPPGVIATFQEMIEHAESQFPLGVLANAVHIKSLVSACDPDRLELPSLEEEKERNSGPPPGLHLPPSKLSLPPVPNRTVSRATSAPAPLVKSTSHSRWIATSMARARRPISASDLQPKAWQRAQSLGKAARLARSLPGGVSLPAISSTIDDQQQAPPGEMTSAPSFRE
jgi:hypothetical protein